METMSLGLKVRNDINSLRSNLERYSVRLQNYVDSDEYFIDKAEIAQVHDVVRTGMFLTDADGEMYNFIVDFTFDGINIYNNLEIRHSSSLDALIYDAFRAVINSIVEIDVSGINEDMKLICKEPWLKPKYLNSMEPELWEPSDGIDIVTWEPHHSLKFVDFSINDRKELKINFQRVWRDW